jgi:hypothetical protein
MLSPDYANNVATFATFHDAQRRLVACLARHPALLQRWLDSKPPRAAGADGPTPDRPWRSVRLTAGRRRQLVGLIERAADGPAGQEELAGWLLDSVPVSTYFEVAAAACPNLREIDPEADAHVREVAAMRDRLFEANFGLAKLAAFRRGATDTGDRLSAASSGLLDAVDRYVPGERSARFSYFATYWIRYHLCRQVQKHGCVVTIPINQHRLRRRLERSLGEKPPALEVISLQMPVPLGESEGEFEGLLRDPAPAPNTEGDEAALDERVGGWLRRSLPSATRVMLAYGRGLGRLGEAAQEYVEQRARALQAWLGPADVDDRAHGPSRAS